MKRKNENGWQIRPSNFDVDSTSSFSWNMPIHWQKKKKQHKKEGKKSQCCFVFFYPLILNKCISFNLLGREPKSNAPQRCWQRVVAISYNFATVESFGNDLSITSKSSVGGRGKKETTST